MNENAKQQQLKCSNRKRKGDLSGGVGSLRGSRERGQSKRRTPILNLLLSRPASKEPGTLEGELGAGKEVRPRVRSDWCRNCAKRGLLINYRGTSRQGEIERSTRRKAKGRSRFRDFSDQPYISHSRVSRTLRRLSQRTIDGGKKGRRS